MCNYQLAIIRNRKHFVRRKRESYDTIFRPLQFYLVLDVTNMTNHEMELHYTQSKCIYMEGKEPCRIPVPVDRCPLNKLSMVINS